jgi:tol-pal system protein YbgF
MYDWGRSLCIWIYVCLPDIILMCAFCPVGIPSGQVSLWKRKGFIMGGRIESGFAWVCCLAVLAGLLGGCASTQETSTLQQSVSMLHERQNVMERRLEGTEGLSHKSGELYSRLEELQMRVGKLNGKIEELEHKIDQLQRTPPPAAAVVPPPPPELSMAPPANPAQEPAPSLQGRQQQPLVVTPMPPRNAPNTPAAPAEPPPSAAADQAAFDRAQQLLQQGKYEAARKEFQGFISRYPKSELADNALLNIGECYFSEKRYQDAIESYQQVMDKYPRGSRVPNALLRQGTAFQQIGDTTAAKIIYERLVEKFPGTAQAQAAEKKLKAMP